MEKLQVLNGRKSEGMLKYHEICSSQENDKMNEKKFKVEIVEVLNDENGFKGEEWYSVMEEDELGHCFEVRNEDVANELCDFVNEQEQKIHDLLKRLLDSELEKILMLRRMRKSLDTIMMDKLIIMSMEFEGIEYEVETDKSICFYSLPKYDKNMKYSAIYDFHAQLKGIDSLIMDISEAEESDDERDLLYVQIEVKE